MNLEWDRAYHDATGKWKLMQHKNKYGKWCGKVPEKIMHKKLTNKDVELCELCSDSNFGLCKKGELEEHLKKFHPNGETLTNLDYLIGFISQDDVNRYYKSDPHYHKYYDKAFIKGVTK